MTLKIKSNSNVRNEGNIENESCSTTWIDPKTVTEPFSNTKNSLLRPQKVNYLSRQFWTLPKPQKYPIRVPKRKNDTKIESKANVRIEGNIENESCSTTWLDPKTVFEPFHSPKNSPLGPQKVKNDPKIKQKSNVRIERNKENESCSTTLVVPKTVFGPFPNPNNIPLGPSKSQKWPQNWVKIKCQSWKKQRKMKVVQLHE